MIKDQCEILDSLSHSEIFSCGAKHGRTQQQYDHFKANESTRKDTITFREGGKKMTFSEMLKSPSDGLKNKLGGKSVKDVRTSVLSASMVKDRSLDQ